MHGLIRWDINYDTRYNTKFVARLHCKKLQRILQCFTVKFYSERLFPQLTVNCCYFYIYFRQILCFYSVKCKILRYTVKNIVRYRDFLTVKYGHPIFLPNTVNFTFYCIFYSKPVIFLYRKLYFFYIKKFCKTNKIQLLVKILTIYC